MQNKLIGLYWLFWLLFTLVIIAISYLIFWVIGYERFDYYGEIAFIICLIIWAGWKKAFFRLSLITLACILIYIVLQVLESTEYKEGLAAFDRQDYVTAVKKLKRVIANEPDHYEAAYRLCTAQYKLGQYNEALPHCNRAINLGYPLENESYASRARVYRSLNRPLKAIKDYTASLEAFNSWHILWERCVMYNQVKKYDKAIDDCQSALKLNKELHEAWWPLGNAYYYKEDFNNALSAYLNYQKNFKQSPEFMQDRITEIRGE